MCAKEMFERLGYSDWNHIHEYTLFRKNTELNEVVEISVNILDKSFSKYIIVNENEFKVIDISYGEFKAISKLFKELGE